MLFLDSKLLKKEKGRERLEFLEILSFWGGVVKCPWWFLREINPLMR